MTDAPAVFKACYSEIKHVKTRGVVAFTFEVPISKSNEALAVLGGVPNSAAEIWCAIAVLNLKPESEVMPAVKDTQSGFPDTRPPPASSAAGAKKSWHTMKPAQQAGILCNEQSFRNFLRMNGYSNATNPEKAADVVREHCDVTSRSDITPDNSLWRDLVSNYRAWMHEPDAMG